MDDKIQLNLETANCVAVGTFNIYIIQPVYLSQMGILEKGTKVQIEADIRQPGFRFTVADSGLKWEVRPDRLAIESPTLDGDCGAVLSQVIEKLKWTPLQGVGVNAVFKGDVETAGDALDAVFPDSTLAASSYEVSQKTWHRALTSPEGITTSIQLSSASKVLTLAINVHTELSTIPVQKEAMEAAKSACSNYRGNLDAAIKVATNLLPVELIHDNVHA